MDNLSFEQGWREAKGLVIPGWDTLWYKNDVDPKWDGVVAVVAITKKRYLRGRLQVFHTVTDEVLRDYRGSTIVRAGLDAAAEEMLSAN
jgi:hypothetical protein